MTLQTEARDIIRLSKQDKAIAAYLEQYGEVDNVTAFNGKIPDAGRVLRLAARIGELRHEHGYEIETRTGPDNNTIYRLISSPKARQLAINV